MRILHIVDVLEVGGLERFVCNLAIEQQRQGMQPSVYCINPSEGFRPVLEKAGVPVTQGPARKRFSPSIYHHLRRASATHATQVIHAHGYVPNFYSSVAHIAQPNKPPRIVTIHDMGDRLSRRSLRVKFAWSMKRTHQLVGVGQQVLQAMATRGMIRANQGVVVYNGVPVGSELSDENLRKEARDQLQLPTNALVVGTAGRLVELKNQQALLQALAALTPQSRARTNQPVFAIIAGAGPLAKQLRHQAATLGISEQVRFTGEVADITSVLHALDLFVLPSHTEGLSMSLLEACAMALPCVATDVGGNREIVQHKHSGLIVPANDQEALNGAIGQLLFNRQERDAYASNALKWVTENGSIEVAANRYQELYEDAIRSQIACA